MFAAATLSAATRRAAFRSARLSLPRAGLATEAAPTPAPAERRTDPALKANAGISPATATHTVEDLHSATAHEILQQGGNRKQAALRHFTVNFGPQHPAAHGVLR
ncbi:hypothetical protein CF328_g389, partial [Tilletia controversa]